MRTLSYIAAARSTYLYLNAIFRIVIPLLFVLPVVSIYLALKETARKSVLLATGLASLSLIGTIALAQIGYSLVGLSDQFTKASSEAEKAAAVASAGSMIRTLGIGEGLSGILLFLWILIVSLVFRSRNLFRPWVAFLGVFAAAVPLIGSVTILVTIVGMSWSAFFYSYLIFTGFFFVLLVWSGVLGYNLYRMGTKKAAYS